LTDIFRAKIPLNIIFDIHCGKQIKYITGTVDHNSPDFVPVVMGKDQLIQKRDLINIQNDVKNRTIWLDKIDAISVQKWMKLHLERMLLYREHKIGPPAQDFIMVLQSPWQLA
jgi:hypothetical protein